ncbi:MAG: hypothetical protein WA212_01430, partial [Candidatus Acidiferrales bacterium]
SYPYYEWTLEKDSSLDLISTQVSGKSSDPDISIPMQAKAEYGELQQRTDLGHDRQSKVS